MQQTDAELAAAWAQEGDAGAFHALYQRHARAVYGFAFGMVGNGHAADDVVQDTFLRAAKRMHSYNGRASLRTWLIAIARNAAFDYGRRAKRRKRDKDREAPPRAEAVPGERIEAEERRLAVRDAVDSLPEKQRLAITLCALQEMPLADAATALGWPEGTLKSTLSRARETLRERLRKHR